MSRKRPEIRVRRVYDPPRSDDGARVLVDRLWPRGLAKADAKLDLWCKDLGPSHELRKWFGHDPKRWDEFRERYARELAAPERSELVADLLARAREGRVTLLFGARDEEHNQARALAEWLLSPLREAR